MVAIANLKEYPNGKIYPTLVSLYPFSDYQKEVKIWKYFSVECRGYYPIEKLDFDWEHIKDLLKKSLGEGEVYERYLKEMEEENKYYYKFQEEKKNKKN